MKERRRTSRRYSVPRENDGQIPSEAEKATEAAVDVDETADDLTESEINTKVATATK